MKKVKPKHSSTLAFDKMYGKKIRGATEEKIQVYDRSLGMAIAELKKKLGKKSIRNVAQVQDEK